MLEESTFVCAHGGARRKSASAVGWEGIAAACGRYANEKFNNCKRARNMHAVNVESSLELTPLTSKKLISSHKSELFVSLLPALFYLHRQKASEGAN